MPFTHPRTVHFADTDAAGVVYFARTLSLCHEAYEEALSAAGIALSRFFADTGTVVPITHAEADYLRPLACGDRLRITATPAALGPDTFEVRYVIERLGPPDKKAATARTVHVCIASADRRRLPLPPALAAWVAAG